MGRPRKPVEDHIRNGTYRPSRHGPLPVVSDDAAAVVPPKKPADLDGAAAEFWDQVVKLLAGVVRDRDGPQLVQLCRWWARGLEIEAALAELDPTAKQYVALVRAGAICSAAFDRLAARFGMTPADRQKLRVIPTGPAKAKVMTRPPTKFDKQGPPHAG